MGYQSETLAKDKEVQNPKGGIVFVHGVCHGAWCWEKYFVPYFSAQGYRCYAVDLRGHGKSKKDLKDARLPDYVEDTKEAVDKCIKEIGMHPYLVGHSMGGAVVQQYLGEYADTVSGAVLFASATAPHMPLIKTFFSTFFNKNLWYAFMVACGCKKNWSDHIHNAAFFTGENEAGEKVQRIEDTTSYESLLQKESWKVFMLDLYSTYSENYKIDIPVFVIGSEADVYFPKESLVKTAQKYAEYKEPAYECLKYLCHDMMIDPDWEIPAELVLKFMEDPSTFIEEHPRPHDTLRK